MKDTSTIRIIAQSTAQSHASSNKTSCKGKHSKPFVPLGPDQQDVCSICKGTVGIGEDHLQVAASPLSESTSRINGDAKSSSEAQEPSNLQHSVSSTPDTACEEPERNQSDLSLALAEIHAPQSAWDHLNHIMQQAILAQKQAADAMDPHTSTNNQGMEMQSHSQQSRVQEHPSSSKDPNIAEKDSKRRKIIFKKDRASPGEPVPAQRASKQPKNNTKKTSPNSIATSTAGRPSNQSNTDQEQHLLDLEKSDTAKQASKPSRIKINKRPLYTEESTKTKETSSKRIKLKISNNSTGKTLRTISTSTHDETTSGGPQVLPRAPSIEPLLSADESDQHSLEHVNSPSVSHIPTPPSSGSTEEEKRVVMGTFHQQTTTNTTTFEEMAAEESEKSTAVAAEPQPFPSNPRPSDQVPQIRKTELRNTTADKAQAKKTKRQREEMDMYAPNIDPSADPKLDVPLPTPFKVSKVICKNTSSSYMEKTLGQVFPKIGVPPPKSMSVDWPVDAPKDHTSKMESWFSKEKQWAKSGVPAKHRAPWSFRPAPKDVKTAERWISSHGQPLQRPGYVSEYSKASKKVLKHQETCEKFPGALRIDEKDPERFLKNLREFVAAEEEDCDSDGETYDERMRRIKSWPPNDTIESDDRIDSIDAATIKEPTAAMRRGDVSGASVPSERYHFNEGANRVLSGDSVRKAVEDKYDVDMAALTLMELSVVSSVAVPHPLSDNKPIHSGRKFSRFIFEQQCSCSGCCSECCSKWCSECRS